MRRRRFEVCVSMHGGFHQRIQELNFTRLPVYTSHWSDREEEIFGGRVGGRRWRWTLSRSRHPRTLSFLPSGQEHSSDSPFTSFAPQHSTACCFSSCPAFQFPPACLALPCFPACLLARESRQALITQASQQFISTGEPTANWKTCTLATIYNESYPVLLSPRLGSINAT